MTTGTAARPKLEALLWDVDGTLAETERDGHRVAFNLAFEAFGLPWRWDDARYGELLRVTGGRARCTRRRTPCMLNWLPMPAFRCATAFWN